MSPDLRTVLGAVGPRLRALRQLADQTLADVSRATGISVSTLSRLESGQRKPTLELLLPLARTHGIPLDELVGSVPTPDPRIEEKPLRRNGIVIVPLSKTTTAGVQAFRQILPTATGPQRPTPQTHEGYEWLYVLSGRLRLVLGEHDLVLKPGEAAEFDTRVPHWMTAVGAKPAEVLCLFGPQGERVHLRARPAPRR